MKTMSILRILSFAVLVIVLAESAMPVAHAAKKPAPKKTTKTVVLGTKQLDGNQAKLGVTYTLGKSSPINITLDKIEYTVEPLRFGSDVVSAKSDQKIMVLHYTLHNCMPINRSLGWSTLEITAVDSNDTNWRYATAVAMEATGEPCNMDLKPAQKTRVYTAILVPAKGEIPKLIFQSSDKLVLRYDIRGKALPLPAPIADPSDPTKATALEKVPAQMGTYYPMRELHGRIDSAEFSTEPFRDRAPGKGVRYLIIKGTVKNNLVSKRSMTWGTVTPKLMDSDGGEIHWASDTYYASRDDSINADIEPGSEVHFRWVFEVPDKVQLQSLEIKQTSDGRLFAYDLTQIK